MAKFIRGNELNSELEKLFESAETQLILISPYIKLHDRYTAALKPKLNNHKLHITIVFGKNEDNPSQSMSKDDFDFFKQFPNIEIRYEKRLHAKYYANESSAIITSMNLYRYSQDNNIEVGVMTKSTLLSTLANNVITNLTNEHSLDDNALEYFKTVIAGADLLFQKEPEYDSVMLGLSKKYKSSKITTDKLQNFLGVSYRNNEVTNRNSTYEPKHFYNKQSANNVPTGYCIRTGKQIPFDQSKPLCHEAYNNWIQFGNEEYPEKYCHFSGELSNGETCYAKPIMRKNWSKAKEVFNF